MDEIWKDIPDYEGIYQASTLGNIRSLDRVSYRGHNIKGVILKQSKSNGYLNVNLSKKSAKSFKVHSLMAVTFLGHFPAGFTKVVDHKDFNKLNNRLDNLRLIPQRKNSDMKHLKSLRTSKYTGVCKKKTHRKWSSQIHIAGKNVYLGSFISEYDAHLAYEKVKNNLKADFI